MQNSSFQKRITYLLKEKIPFAIFKKPASSTIQLQVFEEKEILPFLNFKELINKKGFIFAPFHPKTGKSSFFFPQILREEFDLQEQCIDDAEKVQLYRYKIEYQANKNISNEYKENFLAFQRAFSSDLKKAILSKIITLSTDGLNIPIYFIKIASKYPNAFVYYIQSEKTAAWLGATPETLLSSQNDNFALMSLAGTSKSASWTQKERIEQNYVTEYISDLLYKYKINNFRKGEVENLKAGNFYHLKTKFLVPKKQLIGTLGDFIHDLHPTPAVCGLPKNKSLTLILKTEKHNREYYAGYLGTIDLDDMLDLYVNLRCMKIEKGKIKIFVGGGITKQSQLISEWEETELKAGILLHLL